MRIILPIALALALAFPASADTCTPTTSDPEVGLAGLYVDNDDCLDGASVRIDPNGEIPAYHVWRQTVVVYDAPCTLAVWTYHESNGIEGLQRGDKMHDDTCGGQIEPDTLALF